VVDDALPIQQVASVQDRREFVGPERVQRAVVDRDPVSAVAIAASNSAWRSVRPSSGATAVAIPRATSVTSSTSWSSMPPAATASGGCAVIIGCSLEAPVGSVCTVASLRSSLANTRENRRTGTSERWRREPEL